MTFASKCASFAIFVLSPAVAMQFDVDTHDDPMSVCSDPGKLFFMNVMKDGGRGLRDYFTCLCTDATKCSTYYVRTGEKGGHASCEPTFCASHSWPQFRGEQTMCGPAFSNSKTFTVLRNPVKRMWSYYNYVKHKKHDPFFQQDLSSILQNYKDCQENKMGFRCQEFNNSMVNRYFINPTTAQFRGGAVALSAEQSNTLQSITRSDLDVAKRELAKYDAIFLYRDLAYFPDLFEKSNLPMSQFAHQCAFRGKNATLVNDKIPEVARDLIKELNWADIELFEYAKTLPNMFMMPEQA